VPSDDSNVPYVTPEKWDGTEAVPPIKMADFSNVIRRWRAAVPRSRRWEALKNDGAKRLAPSRDSACNGIRSHRDFGVRPILRLGSALATPIN
jgi:hypothetical protein